MFHENKPLAPKGIRKGRTGVFVSFGNYVPVALHFHVTNTNQSNFKFCWIDQKIILTYMCRSTDQKTNVHSHRDSEVIRECQITTEGGSVSQK